MHLIVQDGFWVMHIPFVRMVKYKLLEQFPVDYLAYSVVSSLIQFSAITYYAIDRLDSITTKPIFSILLRHIYSCFDIVSP